jgi:hypothetical protein
MPEPQIMDYDSFARATSTFHKAQQGHRFGFLVGAGFSRTAGIPLAREVVNMLAAHKLHKRNTEEFLPYSDLIRQVLDGELDTKGAYDALSRIDKRYKDVDQAIAYPLIFADSDIFPADRESRRSFLSSLLSESTRGSYGYNFESLFASYYSARSGNNALNIDTILTTNFDDVLPRSFERLGLTYRTVDEAGAILRENPLTNFPRVLYLHGRHTHYDLINTEHEQHAPTKTRQDAIAYAIHLTATNGGLIVAGHGGWDVLVMDAINENLEKGLFGPGIFWCARGGQDRIPPRVLELAKTYGQMKIVVNCSAMKVSRAILSSAGCDESEVYRHYRSLTYGSTQDFDRRAIQVSQARRTSTAGDYESDKHVGEALSAASTICNVEAGFVNETVTNAFRSGRSAGMALELLDGLDLKISEYEKTERGRLFLWRARLRLQYTSNIQGVLSDVHQAEALGVDNIVDAKIVEYHAFLRLGLKKEAIAALAQMELATQDATDEFDRGKYELYAAFMNYWADELDDASLGCCVPRPMSAIDAAWMAGFATGAGLITEAQWGAAKKEKAAGA